MTLYFNSMNKISRIHFQKIISFLNGMSLPFIIALSFALSLFSCIDRSNPFDPINFSSTKKTEIKQAQKPILDSSFAILAALSSSLKKFQDLFASDSSFNLVTENNNSKIKVSNDSILQYNIQIDSSNAKAISAVALKFKSYVLLQNSLRNYGPYAGFDSQKIEVKNLNSQIQSLLIKTNAQYAPIEIYSIKDQDSVLNNINKDTLQYSQFTLRIEAANQMVQIGNGFIVAYNHSQDTVNAIIQNYNELILFRKSTQNKPAIVQSDSLQAKTFLAKAGDTLILGDAIYAVDLRFTNSGTIDSPIVVRGIPGLKTIFKALKLNNVLNGSPVILSARSNIIFENIVFRAGGISGAKLEAGCRNIFFKHCQFDSSSVWGIEAIDSDLHLLNCLVKANGGVITSRTDPTKSYRIQIENTLIAQNFGIGLSAVSPNLDLSYSTISDNSGSGLVFNPPIQAIHISNSIVSGNGGNGLKIEANAILNNTFTCTTSDIWQNKLGDWEFNFPDSIALAKIQKGNISVNPSFSNPKIFDYSLLASSVLTSYENQPLPVKIGYRP